MKKSYIYPADDDALTKSSSWDVWDEEVDTEE